jgi:CubicO group peptidase (beta-lactamase class C family)
MGYYILQKISERLLNQSMPDFLDQNFYAPMGMNSMGFLPLCRFPEDIIAPTEFDTSWRLSHVRGMVHDQGAALYGGVAGHAGLFSNANDLAKIMQMNLQGGNYGGIKFLEPGVIQSFITKQYMPSRRGIGWDKPTDNAQGPTSRYASFDTFGHTGFTGTATWADPEFGLVYVFLSNRINPSAENRILLDENIRSRIHDIVYESIWSYRRSFHQNGETE